MVLHRLKPLCTFLLAFGHRGVTGICEAQKSYVFVDFKQAAPGRH